MVTWEQWERAALELLKGRALSSLASTVDGVTLQPLYVASTAAYRPSDLPGAWVSRPRVSSLDEARHALSLGVRSLWVGADAPWAEGLPADVEVVQDGARRGATFGIDALEWAGADAAQVLGLVLATAVEGLRALEAAGASLRDAVDRTEVRIATGRDLLGTVATLRALRILWAKLRAASGLGAGALAIHAVTGVTTRAARDPWNNVVRGTLETTSAALGGANAITVLAHDRGLGDSALGRRLAVTLPAILAQESHVTAAAADGACAIDAATDALVRAGWAELQRIEAVGGLSAAGIPARLAQQRAERAAALRRRKTIVVGVNDFAPLHDPPPPVLDGGGFREAAEWEALARAAAGAPVLLATLGPRRALTARLEYTTRLLQAGGFTIHEAEVDSVEQGRASFAASRARAVVLCGADDEYVARLAALCGPSGIVAGEGGAFAGATAVVLAGAPRAAEASHRAAGATDFVFVGADVHAVLSRLAEVSR